MQPYLLSGGLLSLGDTFLGRRLCIIILMLHGGLGAYDDARFEVLGFEEENHRMDMRT